MANLNKVDWSQIPAAEDDGAAGHLIGSALPAIGLPATDGSTVDLSSLNGRSVVYAYPMTGRPDTPLPVGWDGLPGARGCTPQSCAFRDHARELKSLGAGHLFGLSTQDTLYQREAAERLHLPFSLLSDEKLEFSQELGLPTFQIEGKTLLKRITLIIRDGKIEHVFYPVFPPDRNASDVMQWLAANPSDSGK